MAKGGYINRKTAPDAKIARPKISEIFDRVAHINILGDFAVSISSKSFKISEIFESLGSPGI